MEKKRYGEKCNQERSQLELASSMAPVVELPKRYCTWTHARSCQIIACVVAYLHSQTEDGIIRGSFFIIINNGEDEKIRKTV
eukprot:scaffold1717_cov169-Amphora_coffeaeformis.AAC.3